MGHGLRSIQSSSSRASDPAEAFCRAASGSRFREPIRGWMTWVILSGSLPPQTRAEARAAVLPVWCSCSITWIVDAVERTRSRAAPAFSAAALVASLERSRLAAILAAASAVTRPLGPGGGSSIVAPALLACDSREATSARRRSYAGSTSA